MYTRFNHRVVIKISLQVKQLEEGSTIQTPGESPAVKSTGQEVSSEDTDQRQTLQSEIQDLTELKYQVEGLQEVRKTLNDRVEQLQVDRS